jgi:hypothetical protein
MHAADICWDLADQQDDDVPDGDLLTAAIIEAQSYRLVAQAALHELHTVTLERDVLRGQCAIDRRRDREAAA